MSYSTAEILLRDGGFDLKCRGTISVKVRVNAIRYAQIIDYLQVAYVTTTVSFNCSAGKGANHDLLVTKCGQFSSTFARFE